MPQIVINSANINTFSVKVTFDVANKVVIFDFSGSIYNGSGINNILGISSSLIDQDGVVLATIDFSNPINYILPSVTQVFNLDLSSVNYAFLFQSYQISAAIKDQDSTVYTIPVFTTTICQPNDFQESGYVCGMFQVRADCNDNNITVKEFSILVYNNLKPQSVTKSGTLFYPTGTISAITFTNTPFSNNVVYTGQYRINCTTIGTYSLPNDVYVLVAYVTAQQFDITCSNKVSDLLCCISELYQTKVKNCDNAIGKRAAQQLESIEMPFFLGLGQEINGQDSEWAYLYIKKELSCNCGNSSLGQNEVTPINPSVYNIVLQGVGGTTVPSTTTIGSTKTFTIQSNVYQVTKGTPSDTSFSITLDTSVSNTVKYIITFNYANLAASIYTATSLSPTLVAQLNSLISATTNIDLSNLNGKCIIDLSANNYFLSYIVPNGSVVVTSILIGATTYNAPGGLLVSNVSGIEAWLNGLALGTYEVDYSAGLNGSYFNILTNANANNVVSMVLTLTSGAVTVPFQKTNKSLIAFLQAFVDYVCQITSLQVALGSNLSICSFDYNGSVVSTSLTTSNDQDDFNTTAASAICNLANRINTLTGITCSQIQSIFSDSPNVSFNYSTDRYLSIVGGNCVSLNAKQQALAFISAVNADSTTKAAFCAINCSIPGTCPDVSSINFSAINQTTLGFYGVTWNNTPSGNQTVTVYYRVHGNPAWIISSNSINLFPNGNINGTTPYQIIGLTQGTTYDVWVQNNCGGNGFVSQVTTPGNTVYSGSYLLDNVLYNICGDSAVTLYSNSPFASGITMYSDPGLTTPVTGFVYIAQVSTNQIFQLNTVSGVVGTNTGNSCNTGTSAPYILGNSTGTICGGSIVTLYTNGVFSIGGTLYLDSSLTTPVTGNVYVLNKTDGHIYNLNNATGVIGTDTGIICSGNAFITLNSNTVGPCNRTMNFKITGAPSETIHYTLFFNHDTDGQNGNFTITLDGSGNFILPSSGTYILGSSHYPVNTGNEYVQIVITNSTNPNNSIVESFSWSSCPV